MAFSAERARETGSIVDMASYRAEMEEGAREGGVQ